MKKRHGYRNGGAVLLFVLLAAVFLTGCRNTMRTEKDLIRKAREVMPAADADTAEIRYAGVWHDGDLSLHWFVTGREHEEHAYLPMECEVTRGERGETYTYLRTLEADGIYEDIVALAWGDGVCFLINNTDCRGILMTDGEGKAHPNSFEQIPYSAYPLMWYEEREAVEFAFFGAEGNELCRYPNSD